MGLIQYENTNNPGVYVNRLGPDPVLDARQNWRRVEVEGGVDAFAQAQAEEAVRRAQAEQDAILEANKFREDEAALRAQAAEKLARESAIPRGEVHPNVTPTAFHVAGSAPADGVLDRPGHNQGDDPEVLKAKAEADSAAIHAMGAAGGVLNRLGPKPSDFPSEAELQARVSADTANIHASGVGVLHPDHHVGGNANVPESLVDANGDGIPDELGEDPNKDGGPVRPAKDALRADWVKYVLAVKPELTEADVEKLTVPKLQKLVPDTEA